MMEDGDGEGEMAPRRPGGGGRRHQAAPEESTAEPVTPMTKDQVKLAALCQALLMSAEFRMIH